MESFHEGPDMVMEGKDGGYGSKYLGRIGEGKKLNRRGSMARNDSAVAERNGKRKEEKSDTFFTVILASWWKGKENAGVAERGVLCRQVGEDRVECERTRAN